MTIIILTTVAFVYLAACLFVFFKQRSLIYFPTEEAAAVPESSRISLETSGETIRILFRAADSPNAVIYFGGNSEDVSFNLGSFADAVPNHNVYLVNYRGYGGSTGSPSEDALFSDALAVYDLVRARHQNVSVVGRSLGTGVAAFLASKRQVNKLVMVTPYDSVENVAKKHFPIFPVSLLLTDKFDSASRVKDITAQTLVILADNDAVIPRGNSEMLIDRFRSDQVTVEVMKDTTHDSVTFSSDYRELIRHFLD